MSAPNAPSAGIDVHPVPHAYNSMKGIVTPDPQSWEILWYRKTLFCSNMRLTSYEIGNAIYFPGTLVTFNPHYDKSLRVKRYPSREMGEH